MIDAWQLEATFVCVHGFLHYRDVHMEIINNHDTVRTASIILWQNNLGAFSGICGFLNIRANHPEKNNGKKLTPQT